MTLNTELNNRLNKHHPAHGGIVAFGFEFMKFLEGIGENERLALENQMNMSNGNSIDCLCVSII